jgi:hypothetical protein
MKTRHFIVYWNYISGSTVRVSADVVSVMAAYSAVNADVVSVMAAYSAVSADVVSVMAAYSAVSADVVSVMTTSALTRTIEPDM